ISNTYASELLTPFIPTENQMIFINFNELNKYRYVETGKVFKKWDYLQDLRTAKSSIFFLGGCLKIKTFN
ncbi:MAG: hypothetical protein KUG66_00380, partial [Gammaproteobacteria bacterium]|nr:hypothetical protein [Gammaproteobacteria bacterium]